MRRGYWIVLALVLALALGVLAAGCGTQTTTTSAPQTTEATTATTQGPETTAGPATSATSASSTTSTVAANTAPLKIGVAISLTGEAAAPCVQVKEAFETEADYFNSSGGINGRTVQLVFVDDRSVQDGAVAAIQSLIDQKVDIIVGPFAPWLMAGTRPLSEQAKILTINFGPATLDDLKDPAKYKYCFIPIYGADALANSITKAVVMHGVKNVLSVGDQITVDQDVLTLLGPALATAGVKYTKMTDSWAVSDTDVTPIANKIAAKAKEVKPDAIVLMRNPIHENVLHKDLRSLGVTVPIYSSGSASLPVVYAKAAGNDPANVAGDWVIGPAIVDPAQVPDTYPNKADLLAFIKRWQTKYPKEQGASIYLGHGYEIMHVIQQAVANATTQTEDGWVASMEKLDWWGCQGHIVFSPTNHVEPQPQQGLFLWQFVPGGGLKFISDLGGLPTQ